MAHQHDTASDCARDVFRGLSAAAPPLLVAAVACFVFTFPNQILDIYRDVAQRIVLGPIDPETAGVLGYAGIWRELTLSCVAVAVLSVSLWLASQVSIQSLHARAPRICRTAAVAQQLVPIAIALAPVAMLSAGLLSARVAGSTEREIALLVKDTFLTSILEKGIDEKIAELVASRFSSGLIGYNAELGYFAAAAGGLAVCLLALFIVLQARSAPLGIIRARVELRWAGAGVYALTVACAIAAICLLIAYFPVQVADLLTPLPTFCLFCVFLLLAMDVIRRFSDLTGVPLLAVTVGVALVFSLADLNDNHAVRYEEAANALPAKPLPKATDEFEKWLSKREDRNAFAGERSYPIYIVAAQGGGIYAAYHAAAFLADSQRHCPNFAHHLFAISGVSGGSVGAAVFNAMMREAETQKMVLLPPTGCSTSVENTGPAYAEAVHSVLDDDLWSPLQAALLFPDFLQRFIFWPVAKFDRALALEQGLEAAWLGMLNQEKFFNPELKRVSRNHLADAYARHWDTERFKNVPALVLNTTEVGTGHRRLIAPFQFRGTGTVNFFPLQVASGDGKSVQLPLSTAAILSARFPWVTPLGWIKEYAAKTRIVDGGYFENSGVATALDLIKELSEFARSGGGQKLEINLIVLTSADFSPERWLGSGETLGPIQTMLNTRSARGSIEIERAKQALQAMNSDRTSFRTIEVKLRGLGYPLPLGWRLSTATRYLIESQRGVRSKCKRPAAEAAALGDVDCAKELIYQQLSTVKKP